MKEDNLIFLFSPFIQKKKICVIVDESEGLGSIRKLNGCAMTE